jgi:hypothetical protein
VFIYNPSKAITFFESVNETERILKFWFDVIDKCSDKYGMKYNLMGLCCLISIEPAVQNKMVLQNLRLVIDKMMTLVDKVHSSNEKCYQKKIKDNNDDDNEYEEISDDDDIDDDKAKDLLFQMANGDNDFEDEDVEWNEDDDDDDDDNKTYRSITSIDKQREVLFVRDTLNHLSQSNAEYYNNIVSIIGNDKVNKLKEIFHNEEKFVTALTSMNSNNNSNSSNNGNITVSQ